MRGFNVEFIKNALGDDYEVAASEKTAKRIFVTKNGKQITLIDDGMMAFHFDAKYHGINHFSKEEIDTRHFGTQRGNIKISTIEEAIKIIKETLK